MNRSYFSKTIFVQILLLLSLMSATLGFAEDSEVIEHWSSDISIQTNGDIRVLESIRVLTAQDKIKHGIIRNLPAKLQITQNLSIPITYTVNKVFRNGEPTHFSVRTDKDLQFVDIFKKDQPLPAGRYDFLIDYSVHGYKFDSNENYDSFIWYVNGYNWPIKIKLVEAYLLFPKLLLLSSIQHKCFTGYPSNPNYSGAVSRLKGKGLHFVTLDDLELGNGLVISASWPKGFVKRSTELLSVPDEPIQSRSGQESLLSVPSDNANQVKNISAGLDPNNFSPTNVLALNTELHITESNQMFTTESVNFYHSGNKTLQGGMVTLPKKIKRFKSNSLELQPEVSYAQIDGQNMTYLTKNLADVIEIYFIAKEPLTEGTHTLAYQLSFSNIAEINPDTDHFYWEISAGSINPSEAPHSISLYFPELMLASSSITKVWIYDRKGNRNGDLKFKSNQNSLIYTFKSGIPSNSTLVIDSLLPKGFIRN